jgi:hypothetical protein
MVALLSTVSCKHFVDHTGLWNRLSRWFVDCFFVDVFYGFSFGNVNCRAFAFLVFFIFHAGDWMGYGTGWSGKKCTHVERKFCLVPLLFEFYLGWSSEIFVCSVHHFFRATMRCCVLEVERGYDIFEGWKREFYTGFSKIENGMFLWFLGVLQFYAELLYFEGWARNFLWFFWILKAKIFCELLGVMEICAKLLNSWRFSAQFLWLVWSSINLC